MIDFFERLHQVNETFSANVNNGQLQETDVFKFYNYDSRVVLTAPHATKTMVAQKQKKADLFTGALAFCLSEEQKVSSIVRRRYDDKEYWIHDFIIRRNLGDKFFLDIHGIDLDKSFELAVGTGVFSVMDYKKELSLIQQLAEKYGIKMVVNYPDYRGLKGMTKYLQEVWNRPQVLQLEWRRDMRDFYQYPEKVEKMTLPFMRALIVALEKDYPAE